MSKAVSPQGLRAGNFVSLFLAGALFAASFSAQALPSFARQTQQECATCHAGAFGPQLTPYGIKFKLGGYTEASGEASIPLSGMVLAGYSRTQDDLAAAPAHYQTNNNTSIAEAAIFLAGRLNEHAGIFSEFTWEGVSRRWALLESLDLRYASEVAIAGEDTMFGASFNNRPTIQDPLNTTPVWSFPFASAPEDFAPVPAANPVIAGGLDARVFGLTAYLYRQSGLYAEIGGYRAANRQYLINTNAIADPTAPGQKLLGTAPYWRLAYIKDTPGDMFSLGVFGMNGRLRDFNSAGPSDKFRDWGIDAGYQYLGTRQHVFTVGGSYIHERMTLDETPAQNSKLKLSQMKLSGSYHYDKRYGATISRFDTRGSADAILYTNGKPDSNGWIYQLDWTPFGKEDSWLAPSANLRVGLQYTGYGKFDGSSAGTSANNTTYLFTWLAF